MRIVKGLPFLVISTLMASLSAQAAPLKVVASFTILGDLAAQIGGDAVTITTLVGVDGDAHVYQPTPADAKALKNADVIIINGLGFEGWMQRLVESSGSKAKVITASNGISKTLSLAEKGTHNIDPHAWQSIYNGRLYVQNIAKGLQAADATHAKDYADRAKTLDAELAALDGWVKQEIARVPLKKRSVITTHDAFGYFADAYKVTFLAPIGLNTEEEPSALALKSLIAQVKSGNTRALFFENMSNPNILKQLATESGAVVGAKLYADALSQQGGVAATYQAMMTYNVTQLVAAMQKN